MYTHPQMCPGLVVPPSSRRRTLDFAGGTYDLLASWPASLDERLLDLILGWRLGAWRHRLQEPRGGSREARGPVEGRRLSRRIEPREEGSMVCCYGADRSERHPCRRLFAHDVEGPLAAAIGVVRCAPVAELVRDCVIARRKEHSRE
jgi:hypothetical protein